jgi:hypothetical protein
MESDIPGDRMGSRRIEHWLLAAALAVLMAVGFWWTISHFEDTSFSNDPRFVVTSAPGISFSTSQATLSQRIYIWWSKFSHGFQKPRRFAGSTITFPASPASRCLIQAMLNQCTEVNGVRYVIARDVAAGNVQFGHTNTLTGAEWVVAFTEALQHGQPEFYDPQIKAFRKENLVLVTNSPQTVLVIPKSMAAEFQNRRAN